MKTQKSKLCFCFVFFLRKTYALHCVIITSHSFVFPRIQMFCYPDVYLIWLYMNSLFLNFSFFFFLFFFLIPPPLSAYMVHQPFNSTCSEYEVGVLHYSILLTFFFFLLFFLSIIIPEFFVAAFGCLCPVCVLEIRVCLLFTHKGLPFPLHRIIQIQEGWKVPNKEKQL